MLESSVLLIFRGAPMKIWAEEITSCQDWCSFAFLIEAYSGATIDAVVQAGKGILFFFFLLTSAVAVDDKLSIEDHPAFMGDQGSVDFPDDVIKVILGSAIA